MNRNMLKGYLKLHFQLIRKQLYSSKTHRVDSYSIRIPFLAINANQLTHTHTHSTPATCHQQVNGANNKKIVDKKRTSINGKNTCSWSSTSRMSVCVCASRNGSLALPMHCPMVDRQQQQCVYLICQAKMPPAFYLCPPAIFPSIFVRERTWRERESAQPHTHTCVVSATEGANNNNENNNSYS